jgi:hypothetical protein
MAHIDPVSVIRQTKTVLAQFLRKTGEVLFGVRPPTAEDFQICVESLLPLEQELGDRVRRIPDPLVHGPEALGRYRSKVPKEQESFWQWYNVVPNEDIGANDIAELRYAWVAFHRVARIWLEMILHQVRPYARIPDDN